MSYNQLSPKKSPIQVAQSTMSGHLEMNNKQIRDDYRDMLEY